MKKMISNYISYVEEIINNKKVDKLFVDDLLLKISFFQHERLIHFLVTMLVAIITVILLIAFMCIVGLGSTFYIVVSMFWILGWKICRKIKNGTPARSRTRNRWI